MRLVGMMVTFVSWSGLFALVFADAAVMEYGPVAVRPAVVAGHFVGVFRPAAVVALELMLRVSVTRVYAVSARVRRELKNDTIKPTWVPLALPSFPTFCPVFTAC